MCILFMEEPKTDPLVQESSSANQRKTTTTQSHAMITMITSTLTHKQATIQAEY